MAKFDVTGFEEVEKKLLRRERAAVEAVPTMLKEGAKVLVDAQQAQVKSMLSGERSTGDLANSIKESSVKGNDAEKYIEVYPHGKNRRGERNATVGFVQQYGRSNMPARPWMTAANAKASSEVKAAMRKVWEAKQNG